MHPKPRRAAMSTQTQMPKKSKTAQVGSLKSGLSVKTFLKHHYRHFNAAVVIDASQAYVDHLAGGGKMFVTLAGAMSTGELGISLAEMIREGKIHGICSTGANLEEDIFNLVAHDHYRS